MFELISKTHIMPKSLFITSIKKSDAIDAGGFGCVFKGEYKGQLVALKVLNKPYHGVSAFASSILS